MIPAWIKLAYTAFVLVLVPVYARRYGPANFLWFSDVALLAMVPALWLESSLLTSMMALSVMLAELAWNADYFVRLLTGRRLIGLADYMFDRKLSIGLRGLSLFHVFLPLVILWSLDRLGYDPRAVALQTVLGAVVLLLTWLLTDPAKNINWVFGPASGPQKRIPPLAWVGLAMLLWALTYGVTHFVLQRVFGY
jgi:hypothetical protein